MPCTVVALQMLASTGKKRNQKFCSQHVPTSRGDNIKIKYKTVVVDIRILYAEHVRKKN